MTDPQRDCPDCAAAVVRRHWVFRSGCKGCTARGIGRGPNFKASADAGRLTARYREELRMCEVSHEAVKAARAADYEARRGEHGTDEGSGHGAGAYVAA